MSNVKSTYIAVFVMLFIFALSGWGASEWTISETSTSTPPGSLYLLRLKLLGLDLIMS